jgi:uncharacterized membrane protein YtjA (UPF0391 family)
MLKASIVFFCLGLLSIVLGANQMAGLSVEIGRILLGVFLVLTAISYLVTMISGKKLVTVVGVVALLCLSANVSQADETVGTKIKVAASDTKHAAKKAYRKVKDETCTLTKGKVECAADRVKHSVQNAVE